MRTLIGVLALLGASGALAAQDLKPVEKALSQALKENNRKGVESAAAQLLTAGSPEAMKVLLNAIAKQPLLDPKKEKDADDGAAGECHFTLLNAAASFSDAAALGAFADFILAQKAKPVSRDAMAAVCNHANKPLLPLCFRVLEGGTDDLKLMALDQIISLGDKTSVEPLIRAMKANEKNAGGVLLRIGRALTIFTGQDYADSVTNWTGWWEANKDKDWEVKPASTGGSTGTVTDTLDRARMTEVERLQKTAKVLVLGAGNGCKCGHDHDLDHIERVTEQMGLKTETVNKTEFEKMDDAKLAEFIAILGNCTMIREHCVCPLCKPGEYFKDRLQKCVCPKDQHENASYRLSDKGVQKIRKYVENGGYLFAEDWAMEDYVQKAFPEFVIIGPIRPKDETVTVFPKAGSSSHPYLKKIFAAPPREREKGVTITEDELDKIAHTWKIDKETRCIHVRDAERVVVLLTSPELKKTANGDEAVAVTWGVDPVASGGKGTAKKNAAVASGGGTLSHDRKAMTGGRVVYVLSHFGKQGSTSDEHSLQNLLINFLVEANERRGNGPARPAAAAPK
jgi:hypothetical protein